MRALLVAVLMPVCSGDAIADSGLHDCGTRLDGRSGTGYIREGYGLVSASYFGRATGAHLVMKS
jgi:hypothetical protein